MAEQMLRACLPKLKEKYNLLECKEEVDLKFEMGGILEKLGNTTPVLFNNVKGHKMPVIGAMFGDREMFYDFTGTTRENRLIKYMSAITRPMEPERVAHGPVHENVIKRNIDIGRILPIPTFHENDASSFITAGVVVVKDPDTGDTFTSIRRMQFNGRNNLSLLVTSEPLSGMLESYKQAGKDMEVAVVLGYDYNYCLASQVGTDLYGVDKHKIDSALRGEPLRLVKCKTVDLEVPADAEIVLEGVIAAKQSQVEGPFGELMGYYGQVKAHPVMRVSAITHRNDPIMQISAPCKEEHLSNGLIRDVELYAHVNRFVEVTDVNVTIGAGCRFHGFVSIKKKLPGDARTAIITALSSTKDMKHVVIFDDDIDIFDQGDVEGAIASRVQASKDVIIIPGAQGTGLDPSHLLENTTDKMGIDATKPLGEKGAGFKKAKIPGYEAIDLKRFFPKMEVEERKR